VSEIRMQDLDRYEALEPCCTMRARDVNRRHSTGSQLGQDLVAIELRA
jgi:hypothetical protein